MIIFLPVVGIMEEPTITKKNIIDNDVVITIFPGTGDEVEVYVDQLPHGEPISPKDVSFDEETFELVVGERHFDLGFLR